MEADSGAGCDPVPVSRKYRDEGLSDIAISGNEEIDLSEGRALEKFAMDIARRRTDIFRADNDADIPFR